MSHRANTRIFTRRYGRGWWALGKQKALSSADKPAPSDLAFAGTTGPAEGSIPDRSALQANAEVSAGGSMETTGTNGTVDRDLGVTAPPCGVTTATAFIPMIAQVNADRWATLAVIAIFCMGYVIAIVRANRSPKPLRRGGSVQKLDAGKSNTPKGMALAHDSGAAGLSRLNRGLTPDGHRAVENPAGREMPQQPLSSRPPSPPRGPFAGHGNRKASD